MKKSNFSERLKSTGRNDPCPCGSGKKYKKCHLIEDEAAKQKEMKEQEEKLAAANKTEKDNTEDVASNKKDDKVKHPMLKTVPKSKMGPKDKTFNIPRRSAV